VLDIPSPTLIIPSAGPTLIVLTPVAPAIAPWLTPYSARGATQTLDVIFGGAALGSLIQRDVNANLIDMTNPAFRKYQSIITCRDSETPGLDAAWLGAKVTIACAVELAYPVGGSPSRPPVPGSTRTQGNTAFYRPLLAMMIYDVKNSFDEYACRYSYTIASQEV
jgi:hypothetical protein